MKTIHFRNRPWMDKAEAYWAKGYKYGVFSTGVYTGKTDYGSAKAFKWMRDDPSLVWWLAGVKLQISRMWETFEPLALKSGAHTRSVPYHNAQFSTGAELMGVTAKNYDLLASYHPRRLIIDEAAKISRDAARLVTVRMLGAKQVIMMSSPRPTAHWIQWVDNGRKHKDGKWFLIECSTLEAGIKTPEEIAEIRAELPEDFARQELDGQIIEGAGNVFKNPGRLATGLSLLPGKDKKYLMCWDPAKHHDISAITVWRGRKQVRSHMIRTMDYTEQVQFAAGVARAYNCAEVVMDATGPGEAVYEMLREESRKVPRFSVFPYRFESNADKARLVNAAVLAVEQGSLEFVREDQGPEYREFMSEMRAYTRDRSGSGLMYVYSAPEGLFDDFVTTVLLLFVFETRPKVQVL